RRTPLTVVNQPGWGCGCGAVEVPAPVNVRRIVGTCVTRRLRPAGLLVPVLVSSPARCHGRCLDDARYVGPCRYIACRPASNWRKNALSRSAPALVGFLS